MYMVLNLKWIGTFHSMSGPNFMNLSQRYIRDLYLMHVYDNYANQVEIGQILGKKEGLLQHLWRQSKIKEPFKYDK